MTDLFGNIDKLGRGLDAAWTKNEVISSNIANIDTPGYKRRVVEFGNLLEDTEMVELAKNSLYYNLLSQKITGEIQKIEDAIKG